MTAPVTIDRSSYEAAVAALRAQIVAYASAVWATASLSDAMILRLVEFVAPAVQAAALQTANLTSVYLAAVTNTDPLPVDDIVTLGRGTPPEVVYARPVITARTAVARGKPIAEAFDAGYRRLESLATTDMQMAKVRQADASLAYAGVTHYRRVPKGAGTCAMCLIASTKRYNTGDLMEIHPGCDCGVEPIESGLDLDDVLDEGLLEATHAKVKEFTGIEDRGGRAVDYRKLIITQDHGEIGPLLAWKGDHFDGPMDIVDLDAAPRRRSVFDRDIPETPRRERTSAEREAFNRNIADILASIEDID